MTTNKCDKSFHAHVGCFSVNYACVLFTYIGTPEIAGLNPIQALEIVRGCKGLNLIGADVVEVGSHFHGFCMSILNTYSINYIVHVNIYTIYNYITAKTGVLF